MGTESPPAMRSLDMLIFLLALFVGMCGPFNNFIPYVACTDGAPITLELRLACYLFGTCGLVRMLSGLFPDQWGLWMAGMGTMALEIGLTIQLVQSEAGHPDPAPAAGLCGVTLLFMLMNMPQQPDEIKQD